MRILLLPFSYLYLLITYIRNKLYNKGILKSTSFNTSVITVGNITTGGTGKTPLVIYIAKYFLTKNMKVAIVSRGYGRNSTFRMLVCDGKSILHPVDMTGDELYMISEELLTTGGTFWVIADNDRVQGCEYTIKELNPDVIILDDAFQKRNLTRDLDIVMIDRSKFNTFFNKILLPAGDLRESKNALHRASIIIQNNKDTKADVIPELEKYCKPIIRISYKVLGIYDKNGVKAETLPKKVAVIAGLANPDSFYKLIQNLGFDIADKFDFPDHYSYIFKDIRHIKEMCEGGIPIITTHKDYVKLKEFDTFIKEFPVYYLKIGLNFEDNINILENMLNDAVNK